MLRGLVAALAVLLVTGCGADVPPQVTFAAGGSSALARPTQFCNAEFTDCDNDAGAPVELAVPPGSPVRISVPEEVARTPWAVVFRYRDATGEQVDGRSPLLAAGEHTGYTLELPALEDRLLTAQVQQFAAPPQTDPETGEIQFPASATWVLTTDS